MNNDKSEIIRGIANCLLHNNFEEARNSIRNDYPCPSYEIEKRTYTLSQKMTQFVHDGFIDRYSGQKLLNPGILKTISHYFPEEFPYHPHWKMTETHISYWELLPTLDHVYPIAKGGKDDPTNWVTTSMKNNMIKSNYSIDEILWTLHPEGDISQWDGLTQLFIQLVDNDISLLNDAYIRSWYKVSKSILYKDNAF